MINQTSVTENFDKVIASHNTIDVLINNAGILQENTYERMIDINFVCKVTITPKCSYSITLYV